MKVFVAGATGVLGWRSVAQLVAAGHQVTGVARTPEKAALLRGLGAEPVTVDLFDPAAVKDAMAGHEVVCNLATHIPPVTKMAMPKAWAENDRIRTEVSRNLVDAALAAGAQRYIQESIAFVYPDRGDEWIDEDTPIETPAYTRSVLEAEGQAGRFTAAGGTGVVLRFGFFYGPDSHTTVTTVRAARDGMAPMVGNDAWSASINTDDAATAVVAALSAPAGTYNVVDEPVTHREYGAALAAALGTKPPRMVPRGVGRMTGSKADPFTRSLRVSNRRFREATGWAPAYPTVREGWPAVVAELGDDPRDRMHILPRVLLAVLALSALQLGVWAALAPHSFYSSFPGGGRAWVAADGPYNQHLVRDFGDFNLALALVLGVAVVKGGRTLLATAAGAALLFSVPHFLYHVTHLDVYGTSDKVGNVVLLGAAVVMGLVALVATLRPRGTPRAEAGVGP